MSFESVEAVARNQRILQRVGPCKPADVVYACKRAVGSYVRTIGGLSIGGWLIYSLVYGTPPE